MTRSRSCGRGVARTDGCDRMATRDEEEKFRAQGVRVSETRQDAYKSYSKAADLVREKLLALQSLIDKKVPASGGQRVNADAELSVALEMKKLTERDLDDANATWNEWRTEARAREDDERLRRQEGATSSATWAAWGSAVAALATLAMSAWNVWHGRGP